MIKEDRSAEVGGNADSSAIITGDYRENTKLVRSKNYQVFAALDGADCV